MKFRYFTLSEFDSPDSPGSGAKFMSKAFVRRLDAARHIAGIPFTINSGYRTPAHNQRVGSRPTSSHLKGIAADIRVNDNRSRFIIVKALMRAGFQRIGIGRTFIHVDVDTTKAQELIWLYN